MASDIDPDTFADKILARLGKLRPSRDDEDDDDHGDEARGKVPYHRFADKAREAKELRRQLAELGEEVKGYKAATDAKVSKVQSEYEKAVEKMRKEAADSVQAIARGHEEDLHLVDHGLRDPLGRKAARDAYAMLPEAGRPASVAEYVKSLRAGIEARNSVLADAKADPSKAPALPDIPATMRAYFDPLIKQPAEKKPGATAPNVDAGTSRTADVGDLMSKAPGKDYGMGEWLAQLQQAERSARG